MFSSSHHPGNGPTGKKTKKVSRKNTITKGNEVSNSKKGNGHFHRIIKERFPMGFISSVVFSFIFFPPFPEFYGFLIMDHDF